MAIQDTSCRDIEVLLDAYHDGEISPPERLTVEKHLAACPACRERLTTIGQLVSSLRQAARPELSSNFASKLDTLLDAQLASQGYLPPVRASTAPPAPSLSGSADTPALNQAAVEGKSAGPVLRAPGGQSTVVAFRPRLWAPVAVAAAAALLAIVFKVGAPTGSAGGPQLFANRGNQQSAPVAEKQDSGTAPINPAERRQAPQLKLATAQMNQSSPENNATPAKLNLSPSSALVSGLHQEQTPSTQEKPGGSLQIANRRSPTAQVPRALAPASDNKLDEELAELPASSSGFNEAAGVATDEDGLYDLKM